LNVKYLYHRFNESNVLKYIKDRKKAALIAFILITTTVFAVIWFKVMLGPKDATNETFVEFEVSSGITANQLAIKMQEQGIIKNHFVFKLYAKINGGDVKIKSGRYYLSPSMTPEKILDKLVKGEIINNDVKVTIPEGSTLNMIATVLSEKGLASEEDFYNSVKIERFEEKYIFLKEFPPDADLEGFLFPDTYFLPPGKSAGFYIDVLLKRFEEVYFSKVDKTLKENKIDYTPYQIVTLASIIEAEAKLENERPIIAGVFYNRLNKGMPLQSCATIAFILDEHKEVLSFDDLEIDSPYNTYKYNGLPPGPIGAPGLSSILAAANPAKVDYLYFVAKGDGAHIFSKTYSEHLNAENKIQKNKGW
jgi:UPF0755 protein